MKLSKFIDIEAYKAAKYFFSMPLNARDLISRHSADWPTNLEIMVKLSREAVTRKESVNFDRNRKVFGANSNESTGKVFTQKSEIIFFVCGYKGHVATRCPKRIYGIKSNNSNYVVASKINACLNDAKIEAMIDSGASENFISKEFVDKNGIFRIKLKNPVKIELATRAKSILILYETEDIKMNIGNHSEVLRFLVVTGLQEDLILGRPWLNKHNPVIDWNANKF